MIKKRLVSQGKAFDSSGEFRHGGPLYLEPLLSSVPSCFFFAYPHTRTSPALRRGYPSVRVPVFLESFILQCAPVNSNLVPHSLSWMQK